MSIKSKARDVGASRDPSLKIPRYDFDLKPDAQESVCVALDAGQDPIHVPLHDVGPTRRKCTAGEHGDQPCKLCAADVPVRHSWTVRVDLINEHGETQPRTLWLSRQDFGRLSEVLPDSGSCELKIQREIDASAKTKRNDGTEWTVLKFTIYQYNAS